MEKDAVDEARKDVAYARSWEPGGPNWSAMRVAGQDPTRDGAAMWLRAVVSLLRWALTSRVGARGA